MAVSPHVISAVGRFSGATGELKFDAKSIFNIFIYLNGFVAGICNLWTVSRF